MKSRKLLALLLSMIMVVGLVPFAFAEDTDAAGLGQAGLVIGEGTPAENRQQARTNAQQRRATARDNAQDRRATARDNAQDRRATARDNAQDRRTTARDNAQDRKLNPKERAIKEQKDRLANKRDQAKERLANKRDNAKDRLQNKRDNAKERLSNRRDKAKEKFQNKRTQLSEKREKHVQAWHNARQKRVDRFQENHPKAADFLANADSDKRVAFNRLSDARKEELLNSAEGQERLANLKLKKVSRDKYVKHRTIAKEKLQGARNLHREAKEGFKNIREKHKEQVQNFRDINGKIKEICADAEDSTECQDAKDKRLEHAKGVLSNAIEASQNKIDQMMHRIESSEHISEEHAEALLTELREVAGNLDALAGKVDSAETGEDIKAIRNELKENLQHVRKLIKRLTSRVSTGVVRNTLRKSELVSERLVCVADASGNDELSDEAVAVGDDLASARAKFQEARELMDAGDHDAAVAAAKEAREILKNAHNDAKGIHKQLNNAEAFKECRDSDVSEDEVVIVVDETQEDDLVDEGEDYVAEEELDESEDEAEETTDDSTEETSDDSSDETEDESTA